MSYMSSPLSPYLGAIELQFALGPFYTFVSLSLMVLYQLELLHLDDYNLIYGQNKNKGFYKILTTFPLKTQHSPFFFFYNHSSKPIQPIKTIQNNLKNQQGIYPKPHHKHLYWWFGTSYYQTLGKNPKNLYQGHQFI